METKYEIIYQGKGEVDFILDNKIEDEDNEIISELLTNGTLCWKCGKLNESLIGEDRILKAPSGWIYTCEKCKGEN
ncbi:MAG: hypothetical protein ACRC7S_14670 [Cetobacterium sp.]